MDVPDRKILDLIEDTPVKRKETAYLEDMEMRVADSRSDLQ
jgi:hypothetical protein